MPNISPYIPTTIKYALEGNKPIQTSYDDIKDTNIGSETSFLYDPVGYPLKSTQQLEVDWSKFENHTFFSSAEAKVNLAFEKIINGYPFDGSRSEIESFFEKLTGFERWVFDQFPKNRGQLHFSGTLVGEDINGTLGTWIKIKDQAGSLYPSLSTKNDGKSVISPGSDKTFTIETHVYLPEITNGKQIIFQKASDSEHGITLYLDQSASTSQATAKFSAINGKKSVTAAGVLEKGKFNHICATLNRETSGVNFIEFYVDTQLTEKSKYSVNLGDMTIDNSDVLIGSGVSMSLNGALFTPTQTFSGSIDEFRIFHSTRSEKQQKLFQKKSIYSTPELKLYYRFNEPVPPLTSDESDAINAIVLDYSGNSMHAVITNFTSSLRQDASNDTKSLMIYEKEETCPVLFPAYPAIVTLNENLLSNAKDYDQQNPNLITRLVPQHYFFEAENKEGVSVNTENDEVQSYGGNGLPGQGKLSASQIIVSFLYIWAKFFDEIKIFIDSFGNLGYVDYANFDNMPKNFLYDMLRNYGFNFPTPFNDTTIDQYINAENIQEEVATSAFPLKYIQNEMLKRVLINIPDIVRSKGTQHSIRSFLRSVGIDPENSLRIREFGGPTTRQLTFAREKKKDYGAMVLFNTSSLAYTPFLTSSRTEVGFPYPVGNMILKNQYYPHGISDFEGDGLLTSGSWSVEAIYKFSSENFKIFNTQSLLRMCTTGSFGEICVVNLVGTFSDNDSKLTLFARPANATTSPRLSLELPLPSKNVFDDSRWNITFGCDRNDSTGSYVSSSYYLRAGTQNDGEITWYNSTSSYFQEAPLGELNIFRDKSLSYNASGSYILIGSQSIQAGSTSAYRFLNNTSFNPDLCRIVNFSGRASNLRFWSKTFSEPEWKEHVRNYKSRGVENPYLNYNYVTKLTGSWERLRLETLTKQEIKQADNNGKIEFTDFSQNNLHSFGINFPSDKPCIIGEIFDHSYLSPYFDEASSAEKIRIRGYLDYDLVREKPWAMPSPVHEIVASERPNDDVRLSIEFSPIDALNRDIVTIFSSFDVIDNALGSPELVYSPDYPDLDKLKEIYFNRISEKINFKNFFEFYRWFDRTLGTFIEQLVPRKTRFKGTNFVVESHMLERSKLEYQSTDIYLGESDRHKIKDGIFLLQQVVGTLKKY